jgi:ATP-dependent Clp protease, protease subunit
MSLRQLPAPKAFTRPDSAQWDAPSDALERWAALPAAAASEDAATISIFDVIGEDFWTGGGFTAKRAAAALRAIGQRPVTVEINSPGGDMFEGLAIYNILREHQAEVTVKVMGLAASAASVIAMAGDRVTMGLGSFLMIHNAWGVVVGNRNDMRSAAEVFDQFDGAMADIYAARTGRKTDEIAAMMDAETWLNAREAKARGFADDLMDDPAPEGASARADVSARRRLDALLAKQGVPRSERRRLLRDASAGMQDAAGAPATPRAGEPADFALSPADLTSMRALIAAMQAPAHR